jgi:hypothetical protein
MLPEAPATFSMMTDCPSEARMPSAMIRPIVSVGPPAGNGTTIVTGRPGYVCATPLSANPTTAERAIEIRSILREYMVLSSLRIVTPPLPYAGGPLMIAIGRLP